VVQEKRLILYLPPNLCLRHTRGEGGFALLAKYFVPLEKYVGHSLKLLSIARLIRQSKSSFRLIPTFSSVPEESLFFV